MSRGESILIFAGSTRENSPNRALARNAAIAAAELRLDATVLDLREYPLPVYERDAERTTGIPRNAMALRAHLKRHAVWLVVSPDHHNSTSTLLRNVIDWTACPVVGEPPAACFKQKIVGLLSAFNDGTRGVTHLREILVHLGASVAAGEFLLPESTEALDKAGILRDADRRAELRSFVEATCSSLRPSASRSSFASLVSSLSDRSFSMGAR